MPGSSGLFLANAFMYWIQTTDGDLIASFESEEHMNNFYKLLTTSKLSPVPGQRIEPEYHRSELVKLWDRPQHSYDESDMLEVGK